MTDEKLRNFVEVRFRNVFSRCTDVDLALHALHIINSDAEKERWT